MLRAGSWKEVEAGGGILPKGGGEIDTFLGGGGGDGSDRGILLIDKGDSNRLLDCGGLIPLAIELEIGNCIAGGTNDFKVLVDDVPGSRWSRSMHPF